MGGYKFKGSAVELGVVKMIRTAFIRLLREWRRIRGIGSWKVSHRHEWEIFMEHNDGERSADSGSSCSGTRYIGRLRSLAMIGRIIDIDSERH